MLFNSFQFLFGYLPVVLLGCFVLARQVGPAAAQFWLIGGSLGFYSLWNVTYVPLLLCSILFNYAIVMLMLRQVDTAGRRRLLILAVVMNLALLGYYKYSGFLVDVFNTSFGTSLQIGAILLPLGISFYTFQQLTLLVDISNGTGERVRFRDFILFVIFFPHLIAGPIVHHHEMMPQFGSATYRFNWQNMAVGLSLLMIGLFKKVVLADGIAVNISPLYADAAAGNHLSFIYAWAAAVGFTLQLYFDFSGYSEMALGLARMVGIKLPVNFNSPLKASSVIEFWSRWHMTLTRFLTSYIYNPIAMSITRRRLAGGKKAVAGSRTTLGAFLSIVAIPTIATMFLSGLWHGAGYQWIVFGLLHGTYLVVNQAWRLLRAKLWTDKASYERVMGPVGCIITFAAVAAAMPLARADSLPIALDIMGGLIGLHGVTLPAAIEHQLPVLGSVLTSLNVVFVPSGLTAFLKLGLWVAVLLVIALVPPNVLEIMREYEPAVNTPVSPKRSPSVFLPQWGANMTWRGTPAWAVSLALITTADILALSQASEFLYWQF